MQIYFTILIYFIVICIVFPCEEDKEINILLFYIHEKAIFIIYLF